MTPPRQHSTHTWQSMNFNPGPSSLPHLPTRRELGRSEPKDRPGIVIFAVEKILKGSSNRTQPELCRAPLVSHCAPISPGNPETRRFLNHRQVWQEQGDFLPEERRQGRKEGRREGRRKEGSLLVGTEKQGRVLGQQIPGDNTPLSSRPMTGPRPERHEAWSPRGLVGTQWWAG